MEKDSSGYRISIFGVSEIHRERFWKATLTFIFLLLSVALIVAWNTPATGYESSIYRSTPLILWVSVLASFIVGVIIVIIPIAKDELYRSNLWKVGFLLVFLSYTVCLSLFIIRGYHMWSMAGDPATHIGWIKETLNTGHAPTSLVYPITHIYLCEIIFLADLDLLFLHKVVPLIFGLLCVLFMCVLAKALFSNHGGTLLVGVISCCLTFGWYLNLTPNALSNMLIPFALFLIIRFLQKKEWTWAIALSAIIILYPAFHVLTAVVLGLVLLTLWIPTKLPEAIQKLRERKVHILKYNNKDLQLVFPSLLLLIWFIFWITHFWIFGHTIRDIYQTVTLEEKGTKAAAFLDQISYAQECGYSVIEQALKVYGAEAILFALSLLALLLLWRDSSARDDNKFLFSFYGPFFAILFTMGILFIFNLAFGPFRLVIYVSMMGTLFAAYVFSHFLTDRRPEKNTLSQRTYFKVPCVTAVITFLFLVSILILYPSPYSLAAPPHNTQSEVMGMTFFYDHRNVNAPVTGIILAPGRFSHAFLTSDEVAAQHLPMYLYRSDHQVPWHFGYNRYSSLSSVYTGEIDMIITQKDKVRYMEIFPDIAQYEFTNQDFKRLDNDPGVDLIYSNSGLNYWKINTGRAITL